MQFGRDAAFLSPRLVIGLLAKGYAVTFGNCFGNSPGIDEPMLDAPKSLDELLDCFEEAASDVVWRGQAYFMWPAIPTLYRRLRQSGLSDGQINEGVIDLAESRLICDAKKQGLLAKDGSVLGFMACLQHHGGATRLLDVTTDYKVALYFACSSHPDRGGNILSYRINPNNVIDLSNPSTLSSSDWSKLLEVCDDGRPRLVKPAVYDRRIDVQSGAFLLAKLPETLADPNFSTNQCYDAEVRHILINQRLKQEALIYLADQGITENSLFPSMESFAQEHSVRDPVFPA